MSNFDDVIDPDVEFETLNEAMGLTIKEDVTILQLMVKNSAGDPVKVKVRYLPQSLGNALAFDHGSPIQPNVRKPKFDFYKWAKEVLPKMNELALKNIKIINDVDHPEMAIGKGEVRLSLIDSGEFRRLQALCFPGSSDTQDLTEPDNVAGGAKRKGIRGRKPDAPGE